MLVVAVDCRRLLAYAKIVWPNTFALETLAGNIRYSIFNDETELILSLSKSRARSGLGHG